FPYLIPSIPTSGTRDTNARYDAYHPLVGEVPSVGTTTAKEWYKVGTRIALDIRLTYYFI
ncbi:hypothetical protein, partial [Bacteroides clarus]|uniref:hypothetical protein n=1 Tax=Bacteroides clarus TaxID=626929 RepID=UPI00258306B5